MKSQKILVKPREAQKTQKRSPDGAESETEDQADAVPRAKTESTAGGVKGQLCRLRANIITGDCYRLNKGKFSPTARETWGERLKNERAKKLIARATSDTSLDVSSRKTQGRSWKAVGGISRGCSWGNWGGSYLDFHVPLRATLSTPPARCNTISSVTKQAQGAQATCLRSYPI